MTSKIPLLAWQSTFLGDKTGTESPCKTGEGPLKKPLQINCSVVSDRHWVPR